MATRCPVAPTDAVAEHAGEAGPPLCVSWGGSGDLEPVEYRVAGRSVVANGRLPGLDGYEVGGLGPRPGTRGLPGRESGDVVRVCHDDRVQLGARWVRLASSRLSDRFVIDVDGLPPVSIAAVDASIECAARPLAEPSQEAIEAFLGPVLVVALALGGTYCLHASAVARGPRAVTFLGDSGAGKSTLARELARASGGTWLRAADDVLPARAGVGSTHVHPRFPQLKLPPGQQPWRSVPDRLELAAVYQLSPTPGSGPAGCRVEPLSPFQKAAAVAAHTVATRLFDPGLLAAHLEWCRRVASRVPVRRLVYPHRPASFREVLDVLERDCPVPV